MIQKTIDLYNEEAFSILRNLSKKEQKLVRGIAASAEMMMEDLLAH
jgi:hypothetical protein